MATGILLCWRKRQLGSSSPGVKMAAWRIETKRRGERGVSWPLWRDQRMAAVTRLSPLAVGRGVAVATKSVKENVVSASIIGA